MLDKNNLNRIRGILSARQGAEIPKFQTPAGPIGFKPQIGFDDQGFIQFKNLAGLFGSYGDLNTYIGLKEKHPTVSTEELVSIYKGGNPKQSFKVPGTNPVQSDPNASTEKAAEFNEKVEDAKQQTAVIQQAQVAPPVAPVAPSVNNSSSINGAPMAGLSINGSPASALPSKIDTPEAVKSAGMNLAKESYENLEKERKQTALGATIGQAAVKAFDIAGNIVGAKQAATDSDTTKAINSTYDGIASAASNFGPYGQAASAIMKIAGTAGDLIQELGGGTDQMTKMDKWMDSSFFSWNVGMINGFGGKNSDSFGIDQDTLASVGSSYGGSVDDIQDAASKAGKKYGLFSSKARKKANKAIAAASDAQNLMGDIADTASDQRLAAQSMGEQAGLAYSMMTSGGYDQKYTYAAKHGGLLEWNPATELEWQPQVELNWELPTFKNGGNLEFFEELEWIPEFKDGGKTKESDVPEIEETTQKNVIPEGALHKNKHHMEHAEGLTKKGIPVIDEDGEQQAEIEHSEIIFTLEVTKKLEEYYKIYYSESSSNKEKEQAALDAGKLLVYQILENTEDRTGLIESCKKGGTLNFKKSTEDLIEEALEWMPTITIIEEVIEEVKEEKPKKKSEKEQMKEAIKEVLIELLTK